MISPTDAVLVIAGVALLIIAGALWQERNKPRDE